MIKQFLDYHRNTPMVFELPVKGGYDKIEVYLSKTSVTDEYSGEYYFNIDVKGRENFKSLTDKMVEHYLYLSFKQYLTLFSVEGDIYLKFNYL